MAIPYEYRQRTTRILCVHDQDMRYGIHAELAQAGEAIMLWPIIESTASFNATLYPLS